MAVPVAKEHSLHVAFRPRFHRAALVATAVALPVLGLPAVARADDGVAAGDTVVGQVVQAWAEHHDPTEATAHADDSLLTWIEPRDGSEAVRVPTDDLKAELHRIPVGATVAVTVGDPVRDDAAVGQGLEPAQAVLDASVVAPAEQPPVSPAATVTDTVTVVMMAPAGTTPDSHTLADVVAAVNGPVADFWREQSDGRIEIQVSPTGQYDWFQGTADCSNPYKLWDEAATHAHWTRAPGQHLLVYLPQAAYTGRGCAYGLAEVGTGLGSGGRLYVTDDVTSVIAHELGHNFSLGHSSLRQCNATVDQGSCFTTPYYDLYDVMGVSWDEVGSLNVAQAARIGLLDPSQQQTLSWPGSPTTVTLTPVSGRSGTRAVKLVAPDGTVEWLEYRPATGRDAWIPTTTLDAGVLVRQAATGSDTSLLLDGTPAARTRFDGDLTVALPRGREVPLAGGSFLATVDSVGAGGASVRIIPVEGDPSCVQRSAVPTSGVSLLTSGGNTGALVVGLDRGLWYRPIDGGPSSWQSLGGGVLYGPASVAAGSTSYVFVVGLNGALFYRADDGSGWGPWTTLGGYLTASPAAASLGNGHVRVFGRGLDGQLWSRELSAGAWSPWTAGGGYLVSAPTATADPGAGTVDVLVRGLDGFFYLQALALGATAAPYQRQEIAACSSLALGAVQAVGNAGRGAYLDSKSTPKLLQTGGSRSLGGAFTSTPAVAFSGADFVVVGRGLDNGLWLYDGRAGGPGWVSLGGYVV